MHQRPLYYRDDEKLQRCSIFCRRSSSRCCFQALFYYHLSCNFSGVVPAVNVSPTQNHSLSVEPTKRESAETKRGRVYVCVFTGRWMHLRILLPYLYRELRQNGGVVDRVMFGASDDRIHRRRTI